MDNYFRFSRLDVFHKEFAISNIPSSNESHIKIKNFKEHLNINFINLLHEHNIDISLCEMFSYSPYQTLPIHIDGSGNFKNLCKLNYIFGGRNSTVSWYDVKPGAIPRVSKTVIGTHYLKYMDEDLMLCESKELLGAWVVKVGVPHMVTNYNEPRHCISMPLVYKDTRDPISFKIVKDSLQ